MIDTVVDYACENTIDGTSDIIGGAQSPMSQSLLPNLGRASATPYLSDILYVIVQLTKF